ERLGRAGRGRPGPNAAPADRGRHRVGQERLPQLLDRRSLVPQQPRAPAAAHDRSQDGGANHLQRRAAPPGAGGDGDGQSQRPTVDVTTGVIKANFPARIAFAVSSQVDSRTIIDHAGAEKLLGRGDMLYLPPDAGKVLRVQGTYLSDPEIEAIVEFWKYNAPHTPEQIPPAELDAPKSEDGEKENEDKLLAEAGKVVREYHRASVSLLQ